MTAAGLPAPGTPPTAAPSGASGLVRLQYQATDARISSAVFVQTNGFGWALVAAM